ncbi:hypothetical protein [Bacillus alkalicellulosilyticus]|uniref:hypothetical protein n=1 Tax=Alkalihalobacterium alkalicellulosilyticum TaxID=1912214 RepID=UPI000998E2FA|nr:hypothetical protein [Bacillus alkalicellulosilyticus]
MKNYWFCTILFIMLVGSMGCSEETTSSIPTGMKEFTNEEVNIATIIGKDWVEVDGEHISTNSVTFSVDHNTEISVHTSSYFGTYHTDHEVDFLQEYYKNSNSYEEFVDLFLDKIKEETSHELKEIEKVNNNTQIFAQTTDYSEMVFSLIVKEETPFLIVHSKRTENPELELIKDGESYRDFVQMVHHTGPLK